MATYELDEQLRTAQRYFDAWNARDAAAIAATFAEDGTYSDPNVTRLDGAATAAYAEELFAAFPDLGFELESVGVTADGVVAAQWLMQGTNTGGFRGLPPTGRSVAVPGADFIRVGSGGIESVQGYFDGRAVPEQLGLEVIVQPRALGPFQFGRSTYAASGNGNAPGAFSLTVLEARSDAEQEEVRARSREVVQELLATPGFISWVGVTVGRRMYTISAWEDVESVRRLRGNAAHDEAMRRFFGPEFVVGGQTGVWKAERLNGRLVRCLACGSMVREAETCSCGAELPTPPAWW